jgi:hypothetical protein
LEKNHVYIYIYANSCVSSSKSNIAQKEKWKEKKGDKSKEKKQLLLHALLLRCVYAYAVMPSRREEIELISTIAC